MSQVDAPLIDVGDWINRRAIDRPQILFFCLSGAYVPPLMTSGSQAERGPPRASIAR